METILAEKKPPRMVIKNIVDVGVAAVGLIICAPLFLITAAMIKIESRGPIFFKHTRIGRNGKPFKMIKFRTMVKDADKVGPILTELKDPRITRVGSVLRRSSLDELPQLINVLRGEMSLVGPRPEIPEIVETYQPWMRKALQCKPGITGLSQVNGRDDLPLDEKLKYEVKYVENYSLGLDLRILLKTLPAVINGRGNRC